MGSGGLASITPVIGEDSRNTCILRYGYQGCTGIAPDYSVKIIRIHYFYDLCACIRCPEFILIHIAKYVGKGQTREDVV